MEEDEAGQFERREPKDDHLLEWIKCLVHLRDEMPTVLAREETLCDEAGHESVGGETVIRLEARFARPFHAGELVLVLSTPREMALWHRLSARCTYDGGRFLPIGRLDEQPSHTRPHSPPGEWLLTSLQLNISPEYFPVEVDHWYAELAICIVSRRGGLVTAGTLPIGTPTDHSRDSTLRRRSGRLAPLCGAATRRWPRRRRD